MTNRQLKILVTAIVWNKVFLDVRYRDNINEYVDSIFNLVKGKRNVIYK